TSGTVRPRTQTDLLAEVPGIIEAVAPFPQELNSSASFRAGGFFRANDLLLRIEDVDLKTAVAESVANLSRANLQLIQERELAKQARIEWGGRDWAKAPELVRRIPQIQKAEAEAKAAEAKLTQARHNLDRAQVRAPFEGRILKTMADVGQRVGGGTSSSLARIYALDSAEVDLSLSRSEMQFLGLSEQLGIPRQDRIKTEVLDANGEVAYEGVLDRSEGIVDARTRLNRLVARFDDCFSNPFQKKQDNRAEPLQIGQFVKLRLWGEKVRVFVVPNSAFRTQDTLLVVNANDELRIRQVKTVCRQGKEVWVSAGLQSGERVCVTTIEVISEGMKVRIADRNDTKP
ncbi:MAG: efflux RND transporter periplasmic adaptor subunit, partial [Opitutae bacterium]